MNEPSVRRPQAQSFHPTQEQVGFVLQKTMEALAVGCSVQVYVHDGRVVVERLARKESARL